MHKNQNARLQPRRIVALGMSLVLAGCSVTPQPLTDREVRERFTADQYLIYAEQEPITGPIDLNTAIARALKYNLDYRLKLMERALAEGLWDVSRYDMLPRLVASAGYTTRSNEAGGTSVSILDGRETLSPSTSVERSRSLANAEFSWNLLDLGVSYYRAKQLADETLISEERRRRVIQNIVQDVRAAYWRAAGAQRLARQTDDLLERVRDALEKSRQAESQGLMPPTQALAYQRALLDATTLLNIRRQELAFSKRELSALMNVTPGTDFELANEAELALPRPPRNIGELEEVALENRPELREEDYRKRISAAETRRALLSVLPGISLDTAYRYDSNKYLYNNSWAEGGVRVFANLLRFAAYPAIQRANESRLQADDARRTALSMAVITQVRVAVQRYELSLVDLELADEAAKVDERLAQYARAALTTRVDAELEVIRTESRAMIASYQRFASYATAQVAYARIMNSLGLDVLPDEVRADDVRTLAGVVRTSLAELERDTFPPLPASAVRAIPPMRVQIENVADPALAEAARDAAQRALVRAGYVVDANRPDAWPLRMRLDLAAAREGLQRGEWQIMLQRADGSTAGSARYGAALASNVQPSTLGALTEAATVSQLRNISAWLRADPAAPAPK
jgi:outer membrane protein TolC